MFLFSDWEFNYEKIHIKFTLYLRERHKMSVEINTSKLQINYFRYKD